MKTFAEILLAHRRRLSITEAQAARIISVPEHQYLLWEAGMEVPYPITQEGADRRLKGRHKPQSKRGFVLRDNSENEARQRCKDILDMLRDGFQGRTPLYAARLGVGERTIKRDFEFLRRIGYEIYHDKPNHTFVLKKEGDEF